MQGYREDLAYIHDAGFTSYLRDAAPGLLRILRTHGVAEGLVVDLGCGSGRWARELNRAGYNVFGIDQSAAMIRLARRIAPASRFQVASLLTVRLPACDAITSVGECLNYTFDESNGRTKLRSLFRRAYRALRPGGVFVFDIAGPERFPGRTPRKDWWEGPEWAVLVSTTGDRRRNILRRHLTCYRKRGNSYRRSEEIHSLRLYRASDLAEDLARCGFRVRTLAGCGRFRFPRGVAAILAIKP